MPDDPDRAEPRLTPGGLLLALLLLAVLFATMRLPSDARYEYPCPNVEVRLNPWEYELRERECQAALHREGPVWGYILGVPQRDLAENR
ncbi:MAG: hypothetical protein JNJ73_20630 [Hyphomonadaceae bacterium]|nr:hypothetical protein [Hyphomonadaceae bacterium]